jgi:hypothetical protein
VTLKDTHYLDSIWFNYETNDYERIEQSVRYIMAQQHKFNPADRRALHVFNLMVQVHQFEIITIGLKILLAFIGTLTLGIGGVGLMNIMLVSVTQRTREIGVEKALGARRRHIFFQFLAEALTITFHRRTPRHHPGLREPFPAGRLTLYSAMAKHAEGGRHPPHDQPRHPAMLDSNDALHPAKRSLRFVFAANVISMLGSGMNSAAVAWTILQRTHSEMALGTFAALQTIPAMVMLPFTGVIIDREDRRRLVMWLDALRASSSLSLRCWPFCIACRSGNST